MGARTTRRSAHSKISRAEIGSDPPIQVLLYDECEVYRIGMRTVFENAVDMVVVGEAATPDAAASCFRSVTPSVVLVGLPESEPAAAVVQAVGQQIGRPVPVLALGSGFDRRAMLDMLTVGARGLLHRDTSAERLTAAVREVVDGGVVLAGFAAETLVARIIEPDNDCLVAGATMKVRASLEVLTPRQREVLQLVAEGLSNVDIARRLHVSVATVKSHLSGTLQKLNLRDRTQLAVLAHQYGLAQPGRRRKPHPHEASDPSALAVNVTEVVESADAGSGDAERCEDVATESELDV